jgi:hypothetical protein
MSWCTLAGRRGGSRHLSLQMLPDPPHCTPSVVKILLLLRHEAVVAVILRKATDRLGTAHLVVPEVPTPPASSQIPQLVGTAEPRAGVARARWTPLSGIVPGRGEAEEKIKG